MRRVKLHFCFEGKWPQLFMNLTLRISRERGARGCVSAGRSRGTKRPVQRARRAAGHGARGTRREGTSSQPEHAAPRGGESDVGGQCRMASPGAFRSALSAFLRGPWAV